MEQSLAIDIKAMYSNIPLEEGLAAFKECLDNRADQSIPTEYIMKLLRLIITKKHFHIQ